MIKPTVADYIHTEDDAYKWMVSVFWSGGPICPRCGDDGRISSAHRGDRRKCLQCNLDFALKTGTIMRASRLAYLTWLRALCLEVESPGEATARDIAQTLHINIQPAYGLLKKMRAYANAEPGTKEHESWRTIKEAVYDIDSVAEWASGQPQQPRRKKARDKPPWPPVYMQAFRILMIYKDQRDDKALDRLQKARRLLIDEMRAIKRGVYDGIPGKMNWGGDSLESHRHAVWSLEMDIAERIVNIKKDQIFT